MAALQEIPHPTAPAAARPRIIIVGAGFGGLTAAQKLANAPAEIFVIDRHNYHLFQPLLYQVATAALSPADIAAPIRHILRDQKNATMLLDEVIGVDAAARAVKMRSGGAARFDYLILATGSVYSYFGHEDWPHLAPGLKSVDDATDIRRRLLIAFERAETTIDDAARHRLLTFVLVGAGPTGVELAGAIAELARAALARDFRRINPREARIVLVEAGPRVLAGFPEKLARFAAAALRRMGVELRLDTPIRAIDRGGVVARDERIDAATVIWCAGVEATPVAQWLGVAPDKGGTVKVAPDLSLPGHPEIFVIGDAAFVADKQGQRLPGVAAAAKQQGVYVADIIRRRIAGAPPRRRSTTRTKARSPPSGAPRPSPICPMQRSPAGPPGCSGASSTSIFSSASATASPCSSTGSGLGSPMRGAPGSSPATARRRPDQIPEPCAQRAV